MSNYGNTDLARQYRDKFGMEMPTRKLAKIMYNENKLRFSSIDAARNCLSRIEGKMASKNKGNIKVTHPAPERPRNPYKLPDSDEQDFTFFNFPKHKRVAILSDIHAPYHNIPALTATLDYLKKEKPDALLLNGDTLDCHRLSRFIKDPKKRNFALELDTFRALFDVFEKELKCKTYFKIGNHELRYEHFLLEKAHELIGVEEFTFENIIKARARGIEIISDKQPMKLNNLYGIHGHEYVGGITAPVNPARGLFNRAKVSSFQGHNHQTSEHTEPYLSGRMVTTWSLGCLCELHPAYMPLNKWNHGFGIVDLDDNGEDFEFRNKRIYKGKVL